MCEVLAAAACVATCVVYLNMLRLINANRCLLTILDTRPGWNEASARRILAAMGPEGRSANRRLYMMPVGDMWLPPSYGVALAALLCMASPDRSWIALAIPPAGAAAFDICENICIMALLDSFGDDNSGAKLVSRSDDGLPPPFPRWAVRLGPVATVCKWVLILLSFGLLIALHIG